MVPYMTWFACRACRQAGCSPSLPYITYSSLKVPHVFSTHKKQNRTYALLATANYLSLYRRIRSKKIPYSLSMLIVIIAATLIFIGVNDIH